MTYEQSVAGLKKEVQAKVMGNMVRNPFFAFGQLGFAANWANGANGSLLSSLVGSVGTLSHVLTMPSNAAVESDWITLGSGQDGLPLPNFMVSVYGKTSNAPPLVLKVELVDSMDFVAASANFTPGQTYTLQSLTLQVSPSATRKVRMRITAPVGVTSLNFVSLVPGDVEPSLFSPHGVTDEELQAAIGSLSFAVRAHTHEITDVNGLRSALDNLAAADITEAAARAAGDTGAFPIAGDATAHGVKTFDGTLKASNPPVANEDVVRSFDIKNSNVEPYASVGHYTSLSSAGNVYSAVPVPFIERFHSGVNLDFNSATNEFTVTKTGIYHLAVNLIANGRDNGGNGVCWTKIQAKRGGLGAWTTLNQDTPTNVSPGESLDQDHQTEWVGFLELGDVICVMVNHDYFWTQLVHFKHSYLGKPAPTSVMGIVTGDINLHESTSGEVYPTGVIPISNLIASNNQGSVVWSVVSATLPGAVISGNTLSANFAGVGSWTITIQAVDSVSTVTKLLNVVLTAFSAVPLVIGALATKYVHVYASQLPYSDSIQFLPSGGTPPYGYNFDGANTTAPSPTVSVGQFNYVVPTGLVAGSTYPYTVRMRLNDTLTSVNKDIAISVYITPTGGGGGGGGGCTPAGTLFRLADGTSIPVEEVTPGMVAMAFDETTGLPVEGAIVTQTFKFNKRSLWKIQTTVGELIASWDHRPWRVESLPSTTGNNNFPRVEELKIGQSLKWVTADGRLIDAEITALAPTGETATVYHVTLDRGHVYIVGNVAAHNIIKILSLD